MTVPSSLSTSSAIPSNSSTAPCTFLSNIFKEVLYDKHHGDNEASPSNDSDGDCEYSSHLLQAE